MWGIIISVLMAILIGYIGNSIVPGRMPGSIFGSMIAGFAGAWIGALLLGTWGPVIAGFAVIPAIIGSALFVFLLGEVGRLMRGAR